jgi:hypothetical protein
MWHGRGVSSCTVSVVCSCYAVGIARSVNTLGISCSFRAVGIACSFRTVGIAYGSQGKQNVNETDVCTLSAVGTFQKHSPWHSLPVRTSWHVADDEAVWSFALLPVCHLGKHATYTPMLRHLWSEIPGDVLAGVKRFYVFFRVHNSEIYISAVRKFSCCIPWTVNTRFDLLYLTIFRSR